MNIRRALKKRFYKEFLRLNIPIFVAQIFLVLVSIINSVIFGQLGEEVLASMAIVDKLNGIYWPILGAVSTVVSMYFIQNHEKNKKEEIKNIFILTIGFMAILGLVSFGIFILCGKQIILSYNKDPYLMKNSYFYLIAVGLSNLFASLTFGIIAYINGIGKIRESSFIGVVSTMSSLILYYIFIILLKNTSFSGVLGLSVVIILLKLMELLFYMIIYKKRYSLNLEFNNINFFSEVKKLKEIFRFIMPLVFNNIVFMIAVNIIFICFSRKGIGETAALGISDGIIGYFSLLLVGVITSSKIMIGRLLGKKKLHMAYIYANKIIKIIFILSVLCIGVINLCARFYLKFYKVNISTLELALSFIFIASLYFVPKTVNGLIVDGVLRIGGDIKAPMVIDLFGIIVFGVFMSILLTKFTNLDLIVIYILVNINEVLRCFLNFRRFRKKNWLQSLVN